MASFCQLFDIQMANFQRVSLGHGAAQRGFSSRTAIRQYRLLVLPISSLTFHGLASGIPAYHQLNTQ